MDRRTFLRTTATLPLATTAIGCASNRSNVIRVAVTWSGAELAAFRDVIDEFGRLPYDVELVPLGDEIETALDASGEAGPHIVLLPRPGRIADLVKNGKLQPFDEQLWGSGERRYSSRWKRLLFHGPKGESRPYGLPFKAANKSLVWYNKRLFHEYDLGDPSEWTLSDWHAAIDALAGGPIRLLALAGADGWMLTDFFENVLLAENAKVYRDIATARSQHTWDRAAVHTALTELGRLWGRREAFPGGVGRALMLQFPDAVQEVFQRERSAMVMAPDFAEPVVRKSLRVRSESAGDVVGVFRFRLREGAMPPPVGGGDVLVLTASANASARDLARRLADPAAPLPWISRYGGFIAANNRTDDVIRRRKEDSDKPELIGYSAELRKVKRELNQTLRFDLSDQVGAVGGRDALWRVLTEFLLDVGDGRVETDPSGLEVAVESAIGKLERYEDESGI